MQRLKAKKANMGPDGIEKINPHIDMILECHSIIDKISRKCQIIKRKSDEVESIGIEKSATASPNTQLGLELKGLIDHLGDLDSTLIN